MRSPWKMSYTRSGVTISWPLLLPEILLRPLLSSVSPTLTSVLLLSVVRGHLENIGFGRGRGGRSRRFTLTGPKSPELRKSWNGTDISTRNLTIFRLFGLVLFFENKRERGRRKGPGIGVVETGTNGSNDSDSVNRKDPNTVGACGLSYRHLTLFPVSWVLSVLLISHFLLSGLLPLLTQGIHQEHTYFLLNNSFGSLDSTSTLKLL